MAGIEAGIHYPVPIHQTPAFADLGYPAGAFPVAERTAPRSVGFALPDIAAAIGWVNTISAMSAALR